MATKTMTVRLQADISDFQKKMDKVDSKLRTIGKNMKDYGSKVSTTFGAAFISATTGIGLAIKKSMDFNAEMSKVGAIAGASKKDLDKLKQAALELGAKTSLSASQVAQGMELMAAMGFNTNQIISAMPGVISAAEASGEDLALVADVVASALNNFGLKASEASKVADILAVTANRSAAGVEDMQYAFKFAAPVAAQLGISLEDLSAAVGIMANSGIKGSTAGTTLRSALLNLISPTKKQSELTKDLGLKFTDAQGKMLPFPQIIGNLQDALKGMNQDQKAAALSTLFGTEAVSGMMTLVDAGPDKLKSFADALRNSGGASQEAATKMKDNLQGALEELGGAFETAQITLGNALTPAIKKVAGALQEVFNWFNNLSPQAQQFIAIGLALSVGLIGLVAVVGLLVMALGALATAEWAAILPVAAIIAGIVALVAAFAAAYTQLDGFRQGVNEIFSFIWTTIQTILNAIVSFVKEQLDKIKAWWNEHGQAIQTIITVAWNVISTIIRVAMGLIESIIVGTWNNIKGIISGAIDIILGIIGFFADLFTGNWSNLWDDVKQIISGLWTFVVNLFQLVLFGKILKFLGSFGSNAISWVSKWVGNMFGWFKTLGSNVTGAIGQAFNWIKTKIGESITWVIQKVAGWSTDMGIRFLKIVDSIKGAFGSLWNILTSPFRDAWNYIKSIPGKIKDAFENLILKIPKPKLPHVSVKIKHKSILGIDIPYPDFDLNWYKKGGIFNGASVIGIGEQPGVKEAAIPLNGRYMLPFAKAVAENMPENQGGGDTIIIKQMIVREEADIDKIANRLDKLRNRNKRSITPKRPGGLILT